MNIYIAVSDEDGYSNHVLESMMDDWNTGGGAANRFFSL